jgi:hypothetical protein
MQTDLIRKDSLKREYAELLHEKLLRECRKDPIQFIQYIMSWGIPGWTPLGDLHIKWQNSITNFGTRILLVCPRLHSKTSQLLGRIMWELGNNPNLRIKIVCQSDDIAVKRLDAIMTHIGSNPRLHEVFPELKPSEKGAWRATKIYIKREIVAPDPSIEAVGVMSTATGGRADLLVFDDPVDFRNAIQQPALREVVIGSYNDVWINLVEPDGRVFYAATPWHKDDLTHRLLDESSPYFKIVDKIDDNFTPIWPEKWSKEALITRYKEIGSRAFDRAFRMKALTDEETLFDENMLKRCEDVDLNYGELPYNNKKAMRFMGIDLGGAREASGSYTVIFTGALIDGKKIPINITRGRFKSPEFAKIFYDLTKQFKPSLIFIENNASQEAVIQWLREIYGTNISLPIKGYFTGSQKMSEDVGLPAMAVEFEQRSWILPKFHTDPSCKCGYCTWIQELKDFPLSKYSDTVMASWLFRESIREYTGKEPRITIISDNKKVRISTKDVEGRLATIDDIARNLERDEDDELSF